MTSTSSIKDREIRKKRLKNKPYRDAYVASQIGIALPLQIRALREQCELDQKTLAEKAGMKQPRISAIENGDGKGLNLSTLLRLASALDVALVVRFAPFSELNAWVEGLSFRVEGFSPNAIHIPTFEKDWGMKAQQSSGHTNISVLPQMDKSKIQKAVLVIQDAMGNLEQSHKVFNFPNAQSGLPSS